MRCTVRVNLIFMESTSGARERSFVVVVSHASALCVCGRWLEGLGPGQFALPLSPSRSNSWELDERTSDAVPRVRVRIGGSLQDACTCATDAK